MNETYKLGRYAFTSRAEYRRACQEWRYISQIQKEYPLSKENAISIKGILNNSKVVFRSKIGLDYQRHVDAYLREIEQEWDKKVRQEKADRTRRLSISIMTGIIIFLLGGVGEYTISNFYDIYRSRQRITELQGLIQPGDIYMGAGEVAVVPEEIAGEDADTEETEPTVLSEYQELYALNNDLAGWLVIEGTDINYPVMWKAGDNSYYLSHDFDNADDKNGLLVLDYRCSTGAAEQNYLIHGHNMRSGSMFGGLQKYTEQSYYQEHKYISFDTIYEKGRYEVCAVFISQVFDSDSEVFKYYNCLDMSDEAQYEYFIENLNEIKLYDTDAATQYGDTFIMLSTCDYSKRNGRLVVVARKAGNTE